MGSLLPTYFVCYLGVKFSLAMESFVFMGTTVYHFLYPPVPCHHTQHLLITVHAFTCAFGFFCGHTMCLTDLLPPILSFFILHTHLWRPVCPSGHSVTLAWVPAWPNILQLPQFTGILPSIITVHMQSTGPCVSPWQVQKHLCYSQNMSDFVGNFNLSFFIW